MGSTTTSELVVKMRGDIRDLRANMGSAQQQMVAFANAVSGAAGKLDQLQQKGKSGFGNQIANLAGQVFGLQQSKAILDDFVAKTREIRLEAAKLGISTDAYQKLSYAAHKTGGDIEALHGPMFRLSKALVDPTKDATAAFAKLNLNTSELRAMAPDEMFAKVAAAISALPDRYTRTAIAMQLMGKTAGNLLPMMQRLNELQGKAPVIDKGAIEAGKRYSEGTAMIDRGKIMGLGGAMKGISTGAESLGAVFFEGFDDIKNGQAPASVYTRLKRYWGEKNKGEKLDEERGKARAANERRRAAESIKQEEADAKKKEQDDWTKKTQNRYDVSVSRGEPDKAAESALKMGYEGVKRIGGGDLDQGMALIEAVMEKERKHNDDVKKLAKDREDAAKKLASANDSLQETIAGQRAKKAVDTAEEAGKNAKDAYDKTSNPLGVGDSIQDEMALIRDPNSRKQNKADRSLNSKLEILRSGGRVKFSAAEQRRMQQVAAAENAMGGASRNLASVRKGAEQTQQQQQLKHAQEAVVEAKKTRELLEKRLPGGA